MNLTQCKAHIAPPPAAPGGRALLACGVGAPLVFAAAVVAAASQYAGYAHLTQAISELSATGAPSPWLQTANFIVTGLLLTLFGYGLSRSSGLIAGGLLIALFGAVIVIQGLAPCDAGCNFVTTTGTVHNLTGLAGFLLAIAGIWVQAGRAPDGAYRRYSRASAGVALAGFVLWIAVAKIAAVAVANGSLQRVFVGSILLWCAVTAVRELWWPR